MSYNSKTLLVLVVSVLFIFLGKSSLAQYPGMAAFRSQQTLQFANQQMTMMMQMANMRGATAGGMEEDFEVTMRDSSKKAFRSAIYTDSGTTKRFVVYIDKKYKRNDTNRYKKIYPSQTLNLVCVLVHQTDYASGRYVTGIPTDSCWMFKVMSGRINVYSFLAEYQNWRNFSVTFVGIQLNEGPIVQFKDTNLKQMIGEDSNAMEYFEKKDYTKAIKKYNHNIEKAEKGAKK